MVIIERQIQKVRSGQWAELEELDKKFTAIESPLGFPAKRRCRSLVGGLTTDMLIIERQWESFAALEAAYEKSFLIPSIRHSVRHWILFWRVSRSNSTCRFRKSQTHITIKKEM